MSGIGVMRSAVLIAGIFGFFILQSPHEVLATARQKSPRREPDAARLPSLAATLMEFLFGAVVSSAHARLALTLWRATALRRSALAAQIWIGRGPRENDCVAIVRRPADALLDLFLVLDLDHRRSLCRLAAHAREIRE